MTPEKRKTFLWVGAAIIVGILIGSVTTRMFARHFRGHHGGHRREMREGQRIALTDRIFAAVDADSSQRKLMKPIIEKTAARIDHLGGRRDNRHAALDSLRVKLSLILREDQRKKLGEFFSRKRKSSSKKVSSKSASFVEADYQTSL